MKPIISSVWDLFGFKNASGCLSNFICKSKLFVSSTPAKQVFKTCKLLYGYIFFGFQIWWKESKTIFYGWIINTWKMEFVVKVLTQL